MAAGRRLGFDVVEDEKMLPTDFVGFDREVFITGTACGLMPVRRIDGIETAAHGHRPLLDMLRKEMARLSTEPGFAIDIDSDEAVLRQYMAETTPL